MLNYEIIGERLRAKRLESNLTQEKVAEKLEISNEYVSKLENGKVQISLKRLADFSNLYMTPIEYFLTETVYNSSDYKINELTETFEELTSTEKDVIYNIMNEIKKLRNK